jgi:hypothetical protein
MEKLKIHPNYAQIPKGGVNEIVSKLEATESKSIPSSPAKGSILKAKEVVASAEVEQVVRKLSVEVEKVVPKQELKITATPSEVTHTSAALVSKTKPAIKKSKTDEQLSELTKTADELLANIRNEIKQSSPTKEKKIKVDDFEFDMDFLGDFDIKPSELKLALPKVEEGNSDQQKPSSIINNKPLIDELETRPSVMTLQDSVVSNEIGGGLDLESEMLNIMGTYGF